MPALLHSLFGSTSRSSDPQLDPSIRLSSANVANAESIPPKTEGARQARYSQNGGVSAIAAPAPKAAFMLNEGALLRLEAGLREQREQQGWCPQETSPEFEQGSAAVVAQPTDERNGVVDSSSASCSSAMSADDPQERLSIGAASLARSDAAEGAAAVMPEPSISPSLVSSNVRSLFGRLRFLAWS